MEGSFMQSVIVGITGYFLGIITGYFVRDRLIKRSLDDLGGNFVLYVVTMIWALSMIIDFLSPEYETNVLVHGLMGAIVGFFYKPQKDK